MWPPEFSTIGDQLEERELAAIPYEWFGERSESQGLRSRIVAYHLALGTRGSIANALLSIVGVRSVGIATAENHPSIEPYTVAIRIVFDTRSMSDGPITEADRELLRETVEDVLYNNMAAGIRADVTYEDA